MLSAGGDCGKVSGTRILPLSSPYKRLIAFGMALWSLGTSVMPRSALYPYNERRSESRNEPCATGGRRQAIDTHRAIVTVQCQSDALRGQSFEGESCSYSGFFYTYTPPSMAILHHSLPVTHTRVPLSTAGFTSTRSRCMLSCASHHPPAVAWEQTNLSALSTELRPKTLFSKLSHSSLSLNRPPLMATVVQALSQGDTCSSTPPTPVLSPF